jgi:hypothetical protein
MRRSVEQDLQAYLYLLVDPGIGDGRDIVG